MFSQVIDNRVWLEAGVNHDAIVALARMNDVGVFSERQRLDAAYLQGGFGHTTSLPRKGHVD
jgi:hypothetical protein